MRKVCRLAREVLDIAARAAVPGVTTDYIDEVVHKACVERDVSCVLDMDPITVLRHLVVSIAAQLLPLPKISLHITERSHLPWHPRSA